MKNLLSKFKDSLGIPDEVAYADSPSMKRENLSYKRSSFKPSYKMEDRTVKPTKKREYQDERGLVQEEERPLLEGIGTPDKKENARQRTRVK